MYEICNCGHFGGMSPNSMHIDRFQHGHGGCRECDCSQFTWVGFCDAYGKPLTTDTVKQIAVELKRQRDSNEP